ncbi:MAG: glycosyltransferase family 2 protein [Blautia sp.]|nr:glycosyltransferase family 2 protein [Blautia sp.]
MLVSVVIPCYNSSHTIREVVEQVTKVFQELEKYSCEFVLVNDSSKDHTFQVIQELCKTYTNVCGVDLMRNFGQHNALMCGLNYAKGDLILGMDDDMQTHPSEIPVLLAEMEKGYDVVYGIYKKHVNSPWKNFTSWVNRETSRILLGRPKNIISSNFWLIRRSVRDEVILFKNFNPYVDALFYRVTHNIGNVEVEHHKRAYGESNYTFKKMFGLWLSYLNYSVIPLRMVFFLGLFTSVIGIVAAVITVIRRLLDPTILVGWSSIICIIMIQFGLVMLCLGILGEYIGKLLLAVNAQPQYIVRTVAGLSEEDKNGQKDGADHSSLLTP